MEHGVEIFGAEVLTGRQNRRKVAVSPERAIQVRLAPGYFANGGCNTESDDDLESLPQVVTLLVNSPTVCARRRLWTVEPSACPPELVSSIRLRNDQIHGWADGTFPRGPSSRRGETRGFIFSAILSAAAKTDEGKKVPEVRQLVEYWR